MTAEEVKEFLKIPLSTVYGLTKKGKLKGVKVGKHWRYLKSEVEGRLVGSGAFDQVARESEAEFAERRRSQRIDCEIPALITVMRGRQQDTREGVIQNLSASGARFVMSDGENLVPIGAGVMINFKLPTGPSAALELEGKVVRGEVHHDLLLGIEFRSMVQTDRAALEEYVE